MNKPQGKIIIISGPSGVGKDSAIKSLIKRNNKIKYIVPFTTREIRSNEKNGIDYHFIHKEDFFYSYKNNDLFEWDYVLDNYYGFYKENFPLEPKSILITHALARMALRIKSKSKTVQTVFIMPDDYNILHTRLNGSDRNSNLVERLRHGVEEESHSNLFDVLVDSMETEIIVSAIEKHLQT